LGFDQETGEVDRSTVLRVLKFYKVEMSDPCPKDPKCVLLIKGSKVKSLPLPEPCARRTVQKLGIWFGIPTHHFYHPEMMEDASSHVN